MDLVKKFILCLKIGGFLLIKLNVILIVVVNNVMGIVGMIILGGFIWSLSVIICINFFSGVMVLLVIIIGFLISVLLVSVVLKVWFRLLI